MADDRSITGSAAPAGDVHDDDELADVLAAELERYATGSVPLAPPVRPPAGPQQPLQPLAVPRVLDEPRAVEEPLRRPRVREAGPLADRAAEVDRAVRPPEPVAPEDQQADPFRRPDRPGGRRTEAGPVVGALPAPNTEDLPVVRRRGFRPPPTASELADVPAAEPLDRVLPTGPVALPEPTASLLEAMISDSAPHRVARHAAPPTEPQPEVPPAADVLRGTGQLPVPDGLYEDWERSLRSIGRPRAPWEQDEPIVPTGGDPELQTMALPILRPGQQPPADRSHRSAEPTQAPPEPPGHRGAHALPAAPEAVEDAPPSRRRTGRRRAAPPPEPDPHRAAAAPAPDAPATDADGEGIDEVPVAWSAVSAATTGAIDIPATAPRPRTAPVIIERVRTAILQLPSVPASPTGSGAAAIVGRWFGAFASPLALVLGFALAGSGAGPAAAVAVLAGVLLAVPAIARSAAWAATARTDGDLQETAVLGAGPGRAAAVVLLLARIGAAAAVLLLVGTTAGAWADRTGALGLGASNAALIGCAAVGLVAVLVAALPTRASAVLVLLGAVAGVVGTLLLVLLLAPTGSVAAPTTAPGVVAALAAGFAGVGLLVVLCGADVARWRTDLARPASSAVGAVVGAASGAVVLAGAVALAGRIGGEGAPADEFAAALSDASASALAGPLLVVLLLAAGTLPALLLRSAGSAAARLLGAGRPVGLGAVAAGLLALAGALGVLAAGTDPAAVALAAAAVLGVPVAAWAGVLAVPAARGRGAVVAAGALVAVVVGLLLSDGVVPGATSPVLDALGLLTASGLRGGPAVGLLVALVLGALAAAAGRIGAPARGPAVAGPADTVEG